MKAHRVETILSEDGTLILKGLPFQAGEAVEIIILEHYAKSPKSNPYPLQGTVIGYDDPFGAATFFHEDWEAL